MQDKMFQFTHPVWGATIRLNSLSAKLQVSIHAPRVGCDYDAKNWADLFLEFQFTHPVWGETITRIYMIRQITRFNSRTPCGVRLEISLSTLAKTS